MIKGLVTISKVTAADGKTVPLQKAVDYGWICPPARQPSGWGLDRDELVVGNNLFVDQGRQCLAYAFGFRSNVEQYTCRRFGVGTGTTVPRVTDVALESPITLSNGQITAPIDGVDFLPVFVIRVAFTLGLSDANGYAITEMGLFSGNSTLLARKLRAVVINKTADFSPCLLWRIRF